MGNRAEEHAYGTSLGCVSRRGYVLWFCCIMSVLCYTQLAIWFSKSPLWDLLRGVETQSEHTIGCVGTSCYEVWSCFGMREATQHIREPLATLTGAIFFPIGAYGAHHGYRAYLGIFGNYMIASAVVHVGILIADGVFLNVCDMYSLNMLLQTLVSGFLPPSPLTPADQETLLNKSVLRVAEVNQIIGGFNAVLWYYCFAGFWAMLLVYTAWEAHFLADLMSRGPLGLGVHYGLAQWDEVLSHDAIRRHKERERRSQFIDDAKLPLKCPVDVEAPRGFKVSGPGYGAFAAATAAPAHMSSGFASTNDGTYFDSNAVSQDSDMLQRNNDGANYLSEFMPGVDNGQEDGELSPEEEAQAEAWRAMADELLEQETHPERS